MVYCHPRSDILYDFDGFEFAVDFAHRETRRVERNLNGSSGEPAPGRLSHGSAFKLRNGKTERFTLLLILAFGKIKVTA